MEGRGVEDKEKHNAILNHIRHSHHKEFVRNFASKWLEDKNSPLKFDRGGGLNAILTKDKQINLGGEEAHHYFDNLSNDSFYKSKHILTPHISRMMLNEYTPNNTFTPSLYKDTEKLPEALLYNPFKEDELVVVERV